MDPVQPVGQHRSLVLPEQIVSAAEAQAALQVAAPPASVSTVQASPSSGQVVGQVEGGSHVSPPSTTPFPHTGAQSESVWPLHPRGQHLSPAAHAVMGAYEQRRVQSSTRPETVTAVQGAVCSQVAEQAPGFPAVIPLSHDSPFSTAPFPQMAGQSLSLFR